MGANFTPSPYHSHIPKVEVKLFLNKRFLLLAKYASRLVFGFLTQAHNIWLEKQSTLRRFSHEERSVVTDIGLEMEEQKATMKNNLTGRFKQVIADEEACP